MTIISILLTFVCLFNGPHKALYEPAFNEEDCRLIFGGEVLKIGSPTGYGSGGISAYQLVKYRIKDVCESAYYKNVCEANHEDREIIVDHLLLNSNELKDLKVGDRVCLGVTRSSHMDMRYNDEKLRKESDVIKEYYIALDVFIRTCNCS